MTRLIKTTNPSSDRTRLLREIVYAIEYQQKSKIIGTELKEIVEYIVLLLINIQESVEKTSSAWENRGYWVKADKFQTEWEWIRTTVNSLKICLEEEDKELYDLTRDIFVIINNKLIDIKRIKKQSSYKPWKELSGKTNR